VLSHFILLSIVGVVARFGASSLRGVVGGTPSQRLSTTHNYLETPPTMNAIARQTAATAVRSARAPAQKQQKRSIVNWMTNYPDRVSRKLILKRWCWHRSLPSSVVSLDSIPAQNY